MLTIVIFVFIFSFLTLPLKLSDGVSDAQLVKTILEYGSIDDLG